MIRDLFARRLKSRLRAFVAVLFLCLALPLCAAPKLTDVAREIVCDCRDCGKQTIDQCMNNCSRGKVLAKAVSGQIALGKTREQILDQMAATYGEHILGVPRQTNLLGRLAPLAPFLILLLGLFPILYITHTRQRKARRIVAKPAAESVPDEAPGDDAQDDTRLDAALKRFDY